MSVLRFLAAILLLGGPPGPSRPAAPGAPCRCWVVIDFEAILCSSCLEPALDLCASLPAEVQENRVLGVIVFGPIPRRGEAERRRDIAAAKWEALRRSRGLRFPALFDEGPLFRALLAGAAARLLVFDVRSAAVREFTPPVGRSRLDELRALLIH